MTWKIELLAGAERTLEKLDPPVAKPIYAFLFLRLAKLENPRSIGEALHGPELGEFWKYRVGDYRIVARIENKFLRVLEVKVGHRREIYQR